MGSNRGNIWGYGGTPEYGNRQPMNEPNYGTAYGGSRYSRNLGDGRRSGRSGKRSGAVFGRIERGKSEGLRYVRAWRINRYGQMEVFEAFENHKSKEVTSESGTTWLALVGEIHNRVTRTTVVVPCLLNVSRKRIILDKENQIISAAGQGGYWGIHFTKEYKPRRGSSSKGGAW